MLLNFTFISDFRGNEVNLNEECNIRYYTPVDPFIKKIKLLLI